MPLDEARALLATLRGAAGAASWSRVHVHVGSQITTLDPLRARRGASPALARELQRAGIALEYVDLGGGLGISYDGGRGAVGRATTSRRSSARCGATGLPIVARAGPLDRRPGRRAASRASSTSSRATRSSEFVVIDAGMTELMRPALYGAFHRDRAGVAAAGGRERSTRSSGRSARAATSSAAIALLPPLEVGDLRRDPRRRRLRRRRWRRTTIAVRCRPKCSSTTARWRVIRRRQTIDDMLALES